MAKVLKPMDDVFVKVFLIFLSSFAVKISVYIISVVAPFKVIKCTLKLVLIIFL